MHTHRISIIIVNWKSVEYIKKCLESIYSVRLQHNYQILVVDNESSSYCQKMLRDYFPEVCYIDAGSNIGFSAANNLGAEYAEGDILLFLNPDTECIDKAIDIMTDAIVADPACGVIGAYVLNTDYTVQWSSILPYPSIFNRCFTFNFLQKNRIAGRFLVTAPLLLTPVPDLIKVPAVSGACLMIRTKVFEECGKFDTSYFMYNEDIDLCWRVNNNGYRVMLAGQAKIIHHGGQSSSLMTQNFFSVVMMQQSAHHFFIKNKSQLYAFLFRICLATTACARMVCLVPGIVFMGKRFFSSFKKWGSILLWCVGREKWVHQFNRTPHT